MKLLSSFRSKILGLIVLAVAGVGLVSALLFWQLRTQLIEGRRAGLVAAVQSAFTIVDAYRAKADAGKMSVDEAKTAAVEALRHSRFGPEGKDYFYIWTLDTVNVLVPSKPEWAGQRMVGKVLDANGVDVIGAMIDKLKASPDGRTFVEVMFPKPGQTEPMPKLQYVQRVPGWDWMVGSGLYLDGIAAQIWAVALKTLALAGVSIVLLGAAGLWIARGVLRQIGGEPEQARAAMKAVAAGDLGVSVAAGHPDSLMAEIDSTVKSLRSTIASVRAAIESIATASGEIAAGSVDLSRAPSRPRRTCSRPPPRWSS